MTDSLTADDIRSLLGLEPHPEGGFYAETYRSADAISQAALPDRYPGARLAGTCIYYLLTPDTFSAMHRLRSDEVFHFYLGDQVEMLQLLPDGNGRIYVLGPDLRDDIRPQIVVPHGVWQGLRLRPGGYHGYALLGTTVAPGFDFADFELGGRSSLTAAYPDHADRIAALTRM